MSLLDPEFYSCQDDDTKSDCPANLYNIYRLTSNDHAVLDYQGDGANSGLGSGNKCGTAYFSYPASYELNSHDGNLDAFADMFGYVNPTYNSDTCPSTSCYWNGCQCEDVPLGGDTQGVSGDAKYFVTRSSLPSYWSTMSATSAPQCGFITQNFDEPDSDGSLYMMMKDSTDTYGQTSSSSMLKAASEYRYCFTKPSRYWCRRN